MSETTATRSNVMRVRVSDEEREWLERVAREEDRSMSNVLRLALKEFYERRIAEAA
jgi:predicted transcriptional regulator